MLYISFILCLTQSFYLIDQIYGHGYLADPPARSSAWLFDSDFSKCCRYYNHQEMSCGGTFQQWTVNKGKCSVCGEPNDRKPKLLGVGDAMYLGKIVRTYSQGSVIPVTVVLTANHLGVFEFRLCSIDEDSKQDATQQCLDLNVLKVVTSLDSISQTSQYRVSPRDGKIQLKVALPPDFLCDHCVFQWKYRTGNSWGVSNGKGCLGCGKENEEFYGCSDIAIVSSTRSIGQQPPGLRKCKSILTFSQSFDINDIMVQYCDAVCSTNCASDNIPDNDVSYTACLNTCSTLCTCE